MTLTTERFLEHDVAGEVFGYPEQIEFDVVVKNGKVIVIEIKAAAGRSDVYFLTVGYKPSPLGGKVFSIVLL